jgi:hypothetical protein
VPKSEAFITLKIEMDEKITALCLGAYSRPDLRDRENVLRLSEVLGQVCALLEILGRNRTTDLHYCYYLFQLIVDENALATVV